MSIRRTAGAIFWGLTLVALGVVLLLNNLGYPIRIWPYVVRYWPALLIAWGLLKFVDYFRLRHANDNRPLFTAGEVVLLIFVIFVGSAITTAANVSPNIGRIFEIGDIDLWDITGNNYTYEERVEQQNVPPGSEIEIVNLYGDVDVRPSGSGGIDVAVHKTIRAADREEADRLDKDFAFVIREEGGRYRIRSTRDEGGVNRTPRQRFKSSLTVEVPKQASVRIDNRNGRVVIQDLTGTQGVFNRYGDVDVRNVTGRVTVENRNGSVTVEHVSEAVNINNRYANTTVKDVGGDLQIETRNGSVDVSGVKGSATLNNSYAPISVEDIQGDLTISGRNNSVNVRHVEGNLRADSSYENVEIKDPRGAVTLTSRNGDLLISFMKAPEKSVSVQARYGNVTIELPSGGAFKINGQTEYGNIDNEFDGLQVNASSRQKTISGEFGRGGPEITVTTRNGDIRLRKS